MLAVNLISWGRGTLISFNDAIHILCSSFHVFSLVSSSQYLKITPIFAFCCQKTTSGIVDCRARSYCSKNSILMKSMINAFDRIPYWYAVVSLHSKNWKPTVLEVYLTLTLKKTCITLQGKPEFSCVEAGLWLVIITRPSRFWQIIDIKCCILYSAAPFLGLCKAILQISSSISSQSVLIIFLPVYIQVSK